MGGGGADIPVQGAAVGQLLGLLPANNEQKTENTCIQELKLIEINTNSKQHTYTQNKGK